MPVRIKALAAVCFFILAGIVLLASLPETQYLFKPVRRLPFGDKLGHFFLMGFFSFLVNLLLRARCFQVWKVRCLIGSVLVLTVVTLEEFSQLFISSRSFDVADLLFDLAGILMFGELARIVCRFARFDRAG